MAPQNFDRALQFVLIDEGGNDDDPDDAGGRTSRGITQSEYNAWCKIHKQDTGDVWKATDGTIKAIYYAQYWTPWCDRLPTAIDYFYFDMDVNNGGGEAALILQRALDLPDSEIDGKIGVVTVAAVLDAVKVDGGAAKLIDRLCEEHLAVYHKIVAAHPRDEKFYEGWFNRVQHERANALAMLEVADV